MLSSAWKTNKWDNVVVVVVPMFNSGEDANALFGVLNAELTGTFADEQGMLRCYNSILNNDYVDDVRKKKEQKLMA